MGGWLSTLVLLLIAAFGLNACSYEVEISDLFASRQHADAATRTEDGVHFAIETPPERDWSMHGVTFDYRIEETPAGPLAMRLARQPDETKPLIVFCGGNAFGMREHGDHATREAIDHGDVLIWDYPGVGYSGGAASAEAVDRAIDALGDRLSDLRRGPHQKVVFWGFSQGGFVCSEFASRTERAKALVLEAPAVTGKAALKARLPKIARPFINFRVDPAIGAYDIPTMLAGADFPVLILAASRDRVLPVHLARELKAGLKRQDVAVRYREFDKAGHYTISRQKGFRGTVTGFLDAPMPDASTG